MDDRNKRLTDGVQTMMMMIIETNQSSAAILYGPFDCSSLAGSVTVHDIVTKYN